MNTNTTKNKTIIFDNYNGYDYNTVKEHLIDLHIENNEDNMTWINYNPTDEEIYEEADWLQTVDFSDFRDELDIFLKDKTLIVACDNENNDEHGKIIETVNDFEDLVCDCDYITIVDNKGVLEVNFAKHNSGFCYTTLKLLNDKGVDYINDHKYDGSYDLTEDDIKKLLSSYYSTKPRFAEIAYGVKY